MKSVRLLWLPFLVLLLGLQASAAQAAITTYEKPTLKNIVNALIRFGAVDIYNDEVIDVFARTNECAIYKQYYKDVFKWEKVRGKLREEIHENVATFPTGFRYETALTLDRYDFKRGIYPFHDVTRYQSVNTFTLQTSSGDFCSDNETIEFPYTYKMVLDTPITIEGLPLSKEEGEDLFDRMTAQDNKDHIIYANFNIRTIYIAAIATAKEMREREKELSVAKVRQDVQYSSIVLDSRLDSIEYFEDPARTKLIYIYRP